MLIYLPEIIALIGLLMYALSTNAKVSRIGEIMFFAGLLASLITGIHP